MIGDILIVFLENYTLHKFFLHTLSFQSKLYTTVFYVKLNVMVGMSGLPDLSGEPETQPDPEPKITYIVAGKVHQAHL